MRFEISGLRNLLMKGMVIPAHPLALTEARKLDERRQRALTRYYLASGAGGIGVGVHTTQFEIHDRSVGLYVPVLQIAEEECSRAGESGQTKLVRVAGIVGETAEAVNEASLAREIGYDCGLLSLAALPNANDKQLIEHVRAVAEVLPIFGFYLQPAVGGRLLGYGFWKHFVEIDRVVAIKIAPFNRYCTIDVIRAVVESGRIGEIALYTGNDDNIIGDLITPFTVGGGEEHLTARVVGGLLGQWAVWTQRSVEILNQIQETVLDGETIPAKLLTLNAQLTDANSAIFDSANEFKGCLPGIHEILRRQGLLDGIWCLDEGAGLSPGQLFEIDRICRAYPFLSDDDFVKQHLEEWLSG